MATSKFVDAERKEKKKERNNFSVASLSFSFFFLGSKSCEDGDELWRFSTYFWTWKKFHGLRIGENTNHGKYKRGEGESLENSNWK
jgi:hypothetical protein